MIMIVNVYAFCRESSTYIKVKWHCNEIVLLSRIILKGKKKRKKNEERKTLKKKPKKNKTKNCTYSLI